MKQLLIAIVMLASCNENSAGNTADAQPKASATAAAPASPADEAKKIASVRCTMCHGASGKGDGPQAATLNPKPRDLSTKDWQKSVSDAQIRTVILQGGPALGKSPLMPANPDLADKPAVLDELTKLVRAY